jgi:DNA polymerase-3 subunit delta'
MIWTTVGQDEALAALARALESERQAHAYLFVGPTGVGKRTAALDFAAALNCTSDVRPCGECRACRDTYAGKHPDVEYVAPGGICDESDHGDHAASRNLRICQVRRLQRVLSLTPYGGGRRVAILDDADTLHVEAANAFLKTLEEPPTGTVIILLVEREERLPETVQSRCQRVVFRRVARDTIEAALAERGVDGERAAIIASQAGGRIGWAIRAVEDETLLSERETMLDAALRIARAGRVERFEWAAGVAGGSSDMKERYLRELDVWESWWRDVLAAGAGAGYGLVNADREQSLRQESKMYSAGSIVTFLRSLDATREYLLANVEPQLALESLVLDLPQPRS